MLAAEMITAKEFASLIKQGTDFVQRRLNPEHPEYIPSAKIGRKRFIRVIDINKWMADRFPGEKN